MTESTEVRRKRALYRSWHRGTRELDEILGPFAERHVNAMAETQLDQVRCLQTARRRHQVIQGVRSRITKGSRIR